MNKNIRCIYTIFTTLHVVVIYYCLNLIQIIVLSMLLLNILTSPLYVNSYSSY